jgi:hypothetical protein
VKAPEPLYNQTSSFLDKDIIDSKQEEDYARDQIFLFPFLKDPQIRGSLDRLRSRVTVLDDHLLRQPETSIQRIKFFKHKARQ